MRDVVVLDCGSHSTKVGFGGEDLPRVMFPTVVGRVDCSTSYVGAEALNRRSDVSLIKPVLHGRIQMWEEMEEIWQHIFSDDLQTTPEDHPVLLTESPGEPARYREKKCEIFFEDIGTPVFGLATQSILALYAEGRTSGVVVDVGDGHSTIVPVLDGRTIPSAIVPVHYTGSDMTLLMLDSLKHHGFRRDSSVHRDIAYHVKDTWCCVSLDEATTLKSYTLPDKQVLQVQPHQRTIINSFFTGPHSLLHSFTDALSRVDLTSREAIGGAVVLGGGTTDCPGFRQTLAQELKKLGGYSLNPSKVSRGIYKTWVGGSVLSCLNSFDRMSVTRAEYDEYGSGFINRRCVMEQGGDAFYAIYSSSGS